MLPSLVYSSETSVQDFFTERNIITWSIQSAYLYRLLSNADLRNIMSYYVNNYRHTLSYVHVILCFLRIVCRIVSQIMRTTVTVKVALKIVTVRNVIILLPSSINTLNLSYTTSAPEMATSLILFEFPLWLFINMYTRS